MYVLIITGGIGSGKSTAASYLVRDGVLHLDTDQIARQVHLYFEYNMDLTDRSIAIDSQRVVDSRHCILRELNVDNRSDDTNDATLNPLFVIRSHSL